MNCINAKGCESNKDGKDRESIQSSTTPDQGYQLGKVKKNTIKHHKQERRGQPFRSGWQQGSAK